MFKVTATTQPSLSSVVVRVYGEADSSIDRTREYQVLLQLNKAGFGAQVCQYQANKLTASRADMLNLGPAEITNLFAMPCSWLSMQRVRLPQALNHRNFSWTKIGRSCSHDICALSTNLRGQGIWYQQPTTAQHLPAVCRFWPALEMGALKSGLCSTHSTPRRWALQHLLLA